MLPLTRRRPDRPAPRPPDWSRAFGRRLPLEVDLGCGRGAFLLERARAAPEIGLVGVEIRYKWVAAIRAQAAREGLTNLRIIRCDAQHDLGLLFSPGSVRGFTIHHPDPWWKKRHRKRRLLSTAYLEQLTDLLAPGGWIFVQTDVPDLADEIQSAVEALGALVSMDPEALQREQLRGAESHRARKCSQLGIPVRRLAWRRIDRQAGGE